MTDHPPSHFFKNIFSARRSHVNSRPTTAVSRHIRDVTNRSSADDEPDSRRMTSLDEMVMTTVAPLAAVSGELSADAKKRLESIDAWRRMNEEPYYSRGRRKRGVRPVSITEQIAVSQTVESEISVSVIAPSRSGRDSIE